MSAKKNKKQIVGLKSAFQSASNFLLNIFKKKKDGKWVINNVTVRPIHRKSQDIQAWRDALVQAEGYSQQRSMLFDLYADVLLDGHLNAVIQKRITSITNKELTFTINGKEADDVIALTNKSFFETLLKEILKSKIWGHSLIELDWPAPGSESKGETILIPRKHVKPRFGIVTEEQYGSEGIKYREKPWNARLIEIGGDEDLGLLLQAAQYAIYKRGGFGDWAEFVEVFGMPFRWATYNNEESREVLEKALSEAGSAGYVVAPQDASIQFMSTQNQNSTDVFNFMRKACNEEMSITILGNSMTTTEAANSGYAQSKTHFDSQEEIHKDDRKFLLRVLNEKLTPLLAELGYKVKGGEWDFADEETMSLSDRIDIDLKVATQVPVPVSYWYDKYKIPVPTARDLPGSSASPGEGEDEKKKLTRALVRRNELAALYDSCNCAVKLSDINVKFAKIDKGIVDDFLTKFYRGQLKTNDLHPDLFKSYYMRFVQYIESGYGLSFYKPANLDELKLFESMKQNVSMFSAHKHHSFADELAGLRGLPFNDYIKEARELAGRYNIDYLETELDTAFSAANSARRWADYQRTKNIYPNLLYDTAGDERVRESHRAMDGKVFAIDDPIWETWMPPNGYNCRCLVVQTDDPVSQPPASDIEVDKGFAHNPGKSLKVYESDHPYFNTGPDVSDRIIKLAEKARADFEAATIARYAAAFVKPGYKLPGIPDAAKVTTASIEKSIKSTHSQLALKNGLLTALELIFPAMTFVKQNFETYWYQYELLGSVFMFKFYKTAAGLELIGIYDKT